MKKFLVYSINENKTVEKKQTDSFEDIKPFFCIDSFHVIEVPNDIELEDADLNLDTLEIFENQTLKNARLAQERNLILNQIRYLRESKLNKVDQLVNDAYLLDWNSTAKEELKDYRQALLDITETYKLNPELLDSLDVTAIDWPEEPL